MPDHFQSSKSFVFCGAPSGAITLTLQSKLLDETRPSRLAQAVSHISSAIALARRLSLDRRAKK
eukprot:1791345-Pyramimonas_sp.AAC.1